MFKNIRIITICAVFLIALIAGVKITFLTSPLFNENQASISIATSRKAKKGPVEQIRHGTTKDLWKLGEDGVRLHYHIESPYSILTAYPKGSSYELVEKMNGIKCYFQEKVDLDQSRQQIRYLQADRGTYSYGKQAFTAESVLITVSQTDGDELQMNISPSDIFLKGMASQVSLSFAGEQPDFQAKAFRAKIRNPGNLR